MTTGAIHQATRVQVGEEVTRGTVVAATRKLLSKGVTYRYMEELTELEEQMHGTLARTVTAPVLTRNGTEFEIASDIDFDQVLLHLLSGVKGAVTPTTPGTGEARLWTFTPSVTADPLIDTYTIEYAERNMAATPDELGLRAPYGFTTAIEFVAAQEGIPQMNASMVARKTVLAASTAALSLPTTIEFPANMRWAVYFDDTWAGLGTTKISGQVYGVTWRFSEFVRPDYYLEDRADLDFAQYEFKPRTVDIAMDIVLDPAATGFVVVEDGKKTAGTQRFVRFEITGSAFASPDGAFNRFIRTDGVYTHVTDSMQDRGNTREGNKIVRVHVMSAYDTVQAQDIEISVQNTLATFP